MKTGGTFIIAAILFLSLQAQTPVTGDDGTVRATSSSLHKAGKELLVSIEIEITRDFLPNESMTLYLLSVTVWNTGWNYQLSISTAENNTSYFCAKPARRKKKPKHCKEKTEVGRQCIICNLYLSKVG